MPRSKQSPSRNMRPSRKIDASVNNESQVSTNMGPAEAMLWFYSDKPQVLAKLKTAYPALTKNITAHYASLATQKSFKQQWFTQIHPDWVKIRGKIYEFLFNGSTEYIIHHHDKLWVCHDSDKIANLLKTSRLLRTEALACYHRLVIMDIDASRVPDNWFAHSKKIDRSQLRHIQFKGWLPESPQTMAAHLVDQFPQLETLVIEAPDDGDHITINDTDNEYTHEDAQEQPGFAGLLASELFQDGLASAEFLRNLDRGVRRDFHAAATAVRVRAGAVRPGVNGAEEDEDEEIRAPPTRKRKRGAKGRFVADVVPAPVGEEKIRVKLAVSVDVYSDMWLTWRGKEGESLKDLRVSETEAVEAMMMGMALLDFQAGKVEWKLNHHTVVTELN